MLVKSRYWKQMLRYRFSQKFQIIVQEEFFELKKRDTFSWIEKANESRIFLIWMFKYKFEVMINWHHSLIHWHHSSNTLTLASQIRKESCKKFCYLTCSLYSQRANHMISKKIAKFIKLIKRFRTLQDWLKTSDIWRWLSDLKEEFFEAFQILMFLDERTLKK